VNDTKQTYTITKNEWDHYQELKAQVRSLLAESEERKATLARLQTDMASQYATWAREMNERASIILELHENHATQRDAARRNAAALMLTLRALETLVKVCNTPDPHGDWGPPPEEFAKAIREGEEVLRAHGFPF